MINNTPAAIAYFLYESILTPLFQVIYYQFIMISTGKFVFPSRREHIKSKNSATDMILTILLTNTSPNLPSSFYYIAWIRDHPPEKERDLNLEFKTLPLHFLQINLNHESSFLI
jgi:hypothetical protein